MTKKEMVCVVCPKGCGLTVEMDGDSIQVIGNGCERGRAYALSEMQDAKRMFHSTLRVTNGTAAMVSVKSSEPVPRDQLLNFAAATQGKTVKAPVRIGDVLLRNVNGSGIDLVATTKVD